LFERGASIGGYSNASAVCGDKRQRITHNREVLGSTYNIKPRLARKSKLRLFLCNMHMARVQLASGQLDNSNDESSATMCTLDPGIMPLSRMQWINNKECCI
jgi:hypothetical protein